MRLLFVFPLAIITGAGCDARPAQPAAPAPAVTAPAPINANADSLIPGTPPGDLDAWVREIRTGIASIPALVASDPAAAQRVALELYVTRQEYAEMYYGVDGRLRRNEQLAAEVETAEERFHELLKLLAATGSSIDAVRTAVGALDKQQALVTQAWQRTDLRIRGGASE